MKRSVCPLSRRFFGEPTDTAVLLRSDAALQAIVERNSSTLTSEALVAERRTEIEMVAAALLRSRVLTGDGVRSRRRA